MEDKKKLKVLLKVIQIICNETPEMQEVIDVLMIEVCAQESISLEQVFVYFAFSLLLSLS